MPVIAIIYRYLIIVCLIYQSIHVTPLSHKGQLSLRSGITTTTTTTDHSYSLSSFTHHQIRNNESGIKNTVAEAL